MKINEKKESKKALFLSLMYAHIEALFSGNELDF